VVFALMPLRCNERAVVEGPAAWSQICPWASAWRRE